MRLQRPGPKPGAVWLCVVAAILVASATADPQEQTKQQPSSIETPQWKAERAQYVPTRAVSDADDKAFEVVEDDKDIDSALLETSSKGVFGSWPTADATECAVCEAAAYQIVTGRANEKVPPTLPKDTSAGLLAYYKELFVHNLKFYNDSIVAPRLKAQKQLEEATAAVHKEIDQAEAAANKTTLRFRSIDASDAIQQAQEIQKQFVKVAKKAKGKKPKGTFVMVVNSNILNSDETDSENTESSSKQVVYGVTAKKIRNINKRFAQRREGGVSVDSAIQKFNRRWGKVLKNINQRIKDNDKPLPPRKSDDDDSVSSSSSRASSRPEPSLLKDGDRKSVQQVLSKVSQKISGLRRRGRAYKNKSADVVRRLRRERKERNLLEREQAKENRRLKRLGFSLRRMVKRLEKSFVKKARFSARRRAAPSSASARALDPRVQRARRTILRFVRGWKKQLVSLKKRLVAADKRRSNVIKRSSKKQFARRMLPRASTAPARAVSKHLRMWWKFDAAMRHFRQRVQDGDATLRRVRAMREDRLARRAKLDKMAKIESQRTRRFQKSVSRMVDELNRRFRMASRRGGGGGGSRGGSRGGSSNRGGNKSAGKGGKNGGGKGAKGAAGKGNGKGAKNAPAKKAGKDAKSGKKDAKAKDGKKDSKAAAKKKDSKKDSKAAAKKKDDKSAKKKDSKSASKKKDDKKGGKDAKAKSDKESKDKKGKDGKSKKKDKKKKKKKRTKRLRKKRRKGGNKKNAKRSKAERRNDRRLARIERRRMARERREAKRKAEEEKKKKKEKKNRNKKDASFLESNAIAERATSMILEPTRFNLFGEQMHSGSARATWNRLNQASSSLSQSSGSSHSSSSTSASAALKSKQKQTKRQKQIEIARKSAAKARATTARIKKDFAQRRQFAKLSKNQQIAKLRQMEARNRATKRRAISIHRMQSPIATVNSLIRKLRLVQRRLSSESRAYMRLAARRSSSSSSLSGSSSASKSSKQSKREAMKIKAGKTDAAWRARVQKLKQKFARDSKMRRMSANQRALYQAQLSARGRADKKRSETIGKMTSSLLEVDSSESAGSSDPVRAKLDDIRASQRAGVAEKKKVRRIRRKIIRRKRRRIRRVRRIRKVKKVRRSTESAKERRARKAKEQRLARARKISEKIAKLRRNRDKQKRRDAALRAKRAARLAEEREKQKEEKAKQLAWKNPPAVQKTEKSKSKLPYPSDLGNSRVSLRNPTPRAARFGSRRVSSGSSSRRRRRSHRDRLREYIRLEKEYRKLQREVRKERRRNKKRNRRLSSDEITRQGSGDQMPMIDSDVSLSHSSGSSSLSGSSLSSSSGSDSSMSSSGSSDSSSGSSSGSGSSVDSMSGSSSGSGRKGRKGRSRRRRRVHRHYHNKRLRDMSRRELRRVYAEAAVEAMEKPPARGVERVHVRGSMKGLLGSLSAKIEPSQLSAAAKWKVSDKWAQTCCSRAHCVMKPVPPCETDESKAFLQQCGSKDAVLTNIRLRFAGPKANINEVSNKVLALYRAFRRQMHFCRWLWTESFRDNSPYGDFRNFQSSEAFVDLFSELLKTELSLDRIDLKPGAGFVGALDNQFVVIPIKYPFISRILGKSEGSPFGFRGNVMVDKSHFSLTREAYLVSHSVIYLPTSAEILDVAANQIIPVSQELSAGKKLPDIVISKYVRYWCPAEDNDEMRCYVPSKGNFTQLKEFKPFKADDFSLQLEIVSPPARLAYPIFGDYFSFEQADTHYMPPRGCNFEQVPVGKKAMPQLLCEGWKVFAQKFNAKDPNFGKSLDDLAHNLKL